MLKTFLIGALLGATWTAASGAQTPKVSVSTKSVESNSGSVDGLRRITQTAFNTGEKLTFGLRWGVIKAGQSTLSVQGIETIRERPAYHIVSEARSAGMVDAFYKTRDKNETWLDTASLLTVRYEKHIREGRYRVEAVVEMDQVNHRYRDYSERLDKGTTHFAEGELPPNTMDVLGTMYYIRTLPLEVGQSHTVDVYDGKKLWPLVVNVIKREKIKVPAGKFECFLVEPVLREPGIFMKKGRKLQVWMTVDPRHLPVRMRSEVSIGHVAAELTQYELPPPTSTP